MGGTAEPELRFEGFEGAWSLTPLSSLYAKHEERNAIGLGEDKTISVASMTFNPEGSGAEESSLPNYKLLRIGDAAYEGHKNNEYAYGRFVVNDIGIGLMSPRFTALRPVTNLPVSFWSRYMHDENVMRGALVRSTKLGTMMNELVVDDFLSQEIPVPKLAEQEKIGALFERLDSLIEGRASELERLKRSKAALLAKMFPREGEDEPEVRFAGFDGTWERYSFFEFFNEAAKNNTLSRDKLCGSGEVLNIHYGDVLVKYGVLVSPIADKVPAIANAKRDEYRCMSLLSGDVVLADTAEDEAVGKAVELIDINDSCIVPGLHTMAFRPRGQVAVGYLGYYLNSPSFHQQLLKIMQGTKVLSINRNGIRETFLRVPPSLAEQQKISELFQRFDELIAAREQEIECLGRAKRALLQAMFV